MRRGTGRGGADPEKHKSGGATSSGTRTASPGQQPEVGGQVQYLVVHGEFSFDDDSDLRGRGGWLGKLLQVKSPFSAGSSWWKFDNFPQFAPGRMFGEEGMLR